MRASLVDLTGPWRFSVDPADDGLARGFAHEGFDDGAWRLLDAGRSWEAQGVDFDGVAWYRTRVEVPEAWRGDEVRLVAHGVDDEYELFVNGARVGRHGGDGHSVYNRTTDVDVTRALRFGAPNTLVARVRDWGGEGGLTRKLLLRQVLPFERFAERLPEPVLSTEPAWVALSRQAWSLALAKLSVGTAANGFVPVYMDEGFNEQVYQWDSSFIALFARYGLDVFPAMAALDNFYGKQGADGSIRRVYSETDGRVPGTPSADEPMVNPPLFAWVELEYLRFSGDRSRVERVYPVLARYWRWMQATLRAPEGRGLLFQTDLGSGMDNTPRGDVWRAGWIDASAQQVLAARSLAELAAALGRDAEAAAWEREAADLGARVDALAWDDVRGFYFDVTRAGRPSGVRHIGGFWPLLAGIAGGAKIDRLVAHLEDPRGFARPHPFPSLAADEPEFSAHGHYWRGGVWAPTNYMVLKGLQRAGRPALARASAERHLRALASVWAAPPVDGEQIAPEERDGDYATLWECYSPEATAPCTRWDGHFYGRQDFVGWTGLGPIAMLYEDILGFTIDASSDLVVWDVTRTDEHGARRLPLGLGHTFDAVARARASADERLIVDVRTTKALTLEVRRPAHDSRAVRVCPGAHTLVFGAE